MADNGKVLAMPRADVPIIGQPFVFKGGHSTVLVQCQCEAKEPVILIGNMPNFCAACHRGFAVAMFTSNGSGQCQAQIGIVQRQPARMDT